MKKSILIIAIFCSLMQFAEAQIPDSILNVAQPSLTKVDSFLNQNNQALEAIEQLNLTTDSTKSKQKFNLLRWVKSDYPSPKKSLILSAIPGMGQAYNKKYWKIPIVYAAIGGLVFVVDLNNRQYNRLQTAYLATVDEDSNTTSEFEGTRLDDAATLKNLRNSYDKNRQISWFGLIAVYILGGVDAFVDGHLLDFDVSDDLSMKVQPEVGVNLMTASPAVGIGLSFSLK